jgi:hypothetical protein
MKATPVIDCPHEHTKEYTESRQVARWVPSWDENYDENDPQETITLTDYIIRCADCAQVVDCGPASGY